MAHLESGGPLAGIYCRVPHRRDSDQTTVDGQEAIGRRHAAAAGVTVVNRHVYVDRFRSAWKNDGDRRGWTAMFDALSTGEIAAVLLCRPGSLLRYQPRDALELIEFCTQHEARLLGIGDQWDLQNPDHLERFRREALHATRSTQQAARFTGSLNQRSATAGRPHGGGCRPFGYRPGMTGLVEAEAEIVQEVYARFVAGETFRGIAADLASRGIRRTEGGQWSATAVRRLIEAPRYAGLRISHGVPVRLGDGTYVAGMWQPCISLELWERAQDLLVRRSADGAGRQVREYLLTGLLVCTACGSNMVGTPVGSYRMYACAASNRVAGRRCIRSIAAKALEAHLEEQALRILESWESGAVPQFTITARRGSLESASAHQNVLVRPASAFDGVVTGRGARQAWHSLSSAHKAAVLRCLFTVIRIGPKRTARGVFDKDRVDTVLDPGISLSNADYGIREG